MLREYVGTGLVGALAAAADEEEREERATERDALRALQERWDDVDSSVAMLSAQTDLVVKVALMLAGYHQHHRGEWRRKRRATKAEE